MKKVVSVIVFLFLCESLIKAQNDIKQILILGDSHLNGAFGEYLQTKLHETGRFDIYSISIGGAGTRHFTMTLKNHCCGYKIRETCSGEIINPKTKIRTVEKSNSLTNEVIGKAYKGQLKNIICDKKPDYVVICLGNNYVNDHQNLVNTIKENHPVSRIIWVGPYLRRNFTPRIKAIEQVVLKNDIFLVRSDDILGHDTLSSAHFYGKTAQNWANKVIDRMRPVLFPAQH
ncbi:MAG: SGNH/GDSL hydrolase family protein [Flavobacteriales bacterium]|nr:SGNH/GDSL hydrolase family protein [Flavobacteriales bacterium]